MDDLNDHLEFNETPSTTEPLIHPTPSRNDEESKVSRDVDISDQFVSQLSTGVEKPKKVIALAPTDGERSDHLTAHASGGSVQDTKNYTFVTSTSHWPEISQDLTSIAKGEVTLNGIPGIIAKFINLLEPPKKEGTDLFILKKYLQSLKPEEVEEYEKTLFPGIASLILDTDQIFPEKKPLLVQYTRRTEYFSKKQCACLLANMLMCVTIDQKNEKLPKCFNFYHIFTGSNFSFKIKNTKLKCIFHYFRRVLNRDSPNFVVFERLVYEKPVHGDYHLDAWKECDEKLTKVDIEPLGNIEDAEGAVETSFSDRLVGEEVLKMAATQQQIQFFTSPELIIGILFCEQMRNEEAILIRGAEKFCKTTGFKETFAFESNYNDPRQVANNILDREIVIIDAFPFRRRQGYIDPQFSDVAIQREINKAYIGFFGYDTSVITITLNNANDDVEVTEVPKKPISTGKWGCGAYGGNVHLKFILQWAAASRAKREMKFYSFENIDGVEAMKGVEEVKQKYQDGNIGRLIKDVLLCCEGKDEEHLKNFSLFHDLLKLNSN